MQRITCKPTLKDINGEVFELSAPVGTVEWKVEDHSNGSEVGVFATTWGQVKVA